MMKATGGLCETPFREQRQLADRGVFGTSLWEFAPFQMQIPHGAERAGETGVQGSVLLHWWVVE